jgi:hypothetical protein
MANLQDRMDEFKKAFESGAPPYNASRAAIETMHRPTAELRASRIEERALKVGDRAPSFTLFNQDHGPVASADLLRQALATGASFVEIRNSRACARDPATPNQ